jgi:hypothetical protein
VLRRSYRTGISPAEIRDDFGISSRELYFSIT